MRWRKASGGGETYCEVLDVLAAVVLVDRVCDPDNNVAVTSVRQDSDPRLRGCHPYQTEEEEDRGGRFHLRCSLFTPPNPFVAHHVRAIDDCLRLGSSQ